MQSNLKEILAMAEAKGVAVPAFNCYNVESVMGVAQAAKETGAPVIFQMYTRMMDTVYGPYVSAAIREAISQLKNCISNRITHMDEHIDRLYSLSHESLNKRYNYEEGAN